MILPLNVARQKSDEVLYGVVAIIVIDRVRVFTYRVQLIVIATIFLSVSLIRCRFLPR